MEVKTKSAIQEYEHSVAKIVLSCVSELPLRLGMRKVIGILKGTKSTFAIDHQLHKLPTYGIFSTFSKDYLRSVIETLLGKGLLVIEFISAQQARDLPVLKVGPNGYDFIAGKLQLEVPFVDKLTDREVIELTPEERTLFEELRKLRRGLAEEKDLPAYMICPDGVLREISRCKPQTLEALSEIRGVGEKFIQNHGNAFLEATGGPRVGAETP